MNEEKNAGHREKNEQNSKLLEQTKSSHQRNGKSPRDRNLPWGSGVEFLEEALPSPVFLFSFSGQAWESQFDSLVSSSQSF